MTQLATNRSQRETEVWQHLTEIWFSFKPTLMACCREFDLFPPQLMVLQTLDEPKPMRAVAEVLACNSSNLTGITDRLEDRDLVRRQADPDDRRVKLLVLTEAGQELRAKVLERLSMRPETFDELGDSQLDELAKLLKVLNPQPDDG